MIEPVQALLGLLIAIGVWAFLLGAVLLGGGVAAVRRQRTVLALMAVVLIAIALATPVLEQLSGGAIGIALLGVSVLWIGAGIVQRRREPVEVQVRQAEVMRAPRVRWLIVLLVAFLVLMSVLAAVLGRMSSQ
jgi:hypothetical protein